MCQRRYALSPTFQLILTGTCTVSNGQAVCQCPPGFQGPTCGASILAVTCSPNPCQNEGMCEPVGGKLSVLSLIVLFRSSRRRICLSLWYWIHWPHLRGCGESFLFSLYWKIGERLAVDCIRAADLYRHYHPGPFTILVEYPKAGNVSSCQGIFLILSTPTHPISALLL